MDPSSPPPSQEPLVPVQVVDRQPAPPRRRRSRLLGSVLIFLLLLGLGTSVLLNLVLLVFGGSLGGAARVREKFFSHNRHGDQKVAIISVEGVIYAEDGGFVKRQIDQAAKDDAVKAVVLRVNSPGGTITGSDYLYHHLRKLREESGKPIVVSMGSLAASGGYYVSMAVGDTPDSIFAERTTWTGSIGVIIPHYDASALLEKLGVEEDSIASNPLKNMGSFTRKKTEEERQTERRIFQELVDESFTHFKDIVKQGRPEFRNDGGSKDLDKLATGQVYTAEQALKLGLVDKIGFIEDAVDRAIELAGLNKDEVCVVKYQREPSLSDILLGVKTQRRGLDLAGLLDATAPRAYYLYTCIPPLVRSGN
jgi:protease-4